MQAGALALGNPAFGKKELKTMTAGLPGQRNTPQGAKMNCKTLNMLAIPLVFPRTGVAVTS
jgi:hypothetical protein